MPQPQPHLTYADFQQAAQQLQVDVPSVRAVTAVESGGTGFLPDGRVVLRFEPHIFSRYTKGQYDQSHPNVSYPAWKPGYPTGIEQSYQLLAEAATLAPYYAGISCSYGLFQCMGFNFATCGCETFKDFYGQVTHSEAAQLALFCQFVRLNDLSDLLRQHDWAGFAKHYNGAAYQQNHYDEKLAQAYARFKASEPAA